MIDDRGWTRDQSELEQATILLWWHDRPGASLAFIRQERPDLTSRLESIVVSLEKRGLAEVSREHDDLDWWSGRASADGVALVARYRTQARDNRLRRDACRDAALEWLEEAHANGLRHPGTGGFFKDTRSYFFGEQFTGEDLDNALALLRRDGFIIGQPYPGGGMVLMQITAKGESVVQHHGSSVIASQAPQPQPQPTQFTQNINGPVTGSQIAFGESITQSQRSGLDATEFSELIAAVVQATGLLSDADQQAANAYLSTLQNEVTETDPDVDFIAKTIGRLESLAARAGNATFNTTVGALARRLIESIGLG